MVTKKQSQKRSVNPILDEGTGAISESNTELDKMITEELGGDILESNEESTLDTLFTAQLSLFYAMLSGFLGLLQALLQHGKLSRPVVEGAATKIWVGLHNAGPELEKLGIRPDVEDIVSNMITDMLGETTWRNRAERIFVK